VPMIGFGQKIELINYLDSCVGIPIGPGLETDRKSWFYFKENQEANNIYNIDDAYLCKYLSDYMYKRDKSILSSETSSYMRMLGLLGDYKDTIIQADTLCWFYTGIPLLSQRTKIAIWGWDHLLNKYYTILKILMTKEEFKLIKESQISWIDFRDKEYQNTEIRFKNINRFKKDGYSFQSELYRNRVEQLYFYIHSTDYFIMNCK